MNFFAEDKENYGKPKKEVRDFKRGLTYAWWGGHQITIYDAFGREIDIFNVGDFSKENASTDDISEAIKDRIEHPTPIYDQYGNEIKEKIRSEEGRCFEGYHWVKTHYTKDGTKVSGHCAKNPYGSTQHFTDLMNDSKKQGIGSYGRRK